MELSSLTASVTLYVVRMIFYEAESHWEIIHQLVGLLLLLEDGGCRVILILALGARSVPVRVSQLAATDAGTAGRVGFLVPTSDGSSSLCGLG